MTDLGLKEIIQIDCGYITLSLNRDAVGNIKNRAFLAVSNVKP